MIKIMITGAAKTGKSHIMLHISKLLANTGASVLAVDNTKAMGSRFFFNLDSHLESPLNCPSPMLVCSDGFDTLIAGTHFENKVFESSLPDFEIDSYEYILVECDQQSAFIETSQYNSILLIQDTEKESMYMNKYILDNLKATCPKLPVITVLNKYILCKLNKRYLCRHLGVDIEPQNIIPLNIPDLEYSASCKMDGRIKLKCFSREHNRSVFNLACEISGLEASNRNYRKTVF